MAILKKLFGNLMSSSDVAQGTSRVPTVDRGQALFKSELGKLLLKIDKEMRESDAVRSYYDLKATDSETYKALKKDPEKAAALARFIFANRAEVIQPVEGRSDWMRSHWRGFAVFTSLMRSTLPIEPEELLDWMAQMKRDCDDHKKHRNNGHSHLNQWPIGFMVQMIERKSKKAPLSEEALEQLNAMLAWPEMTNETYYGTDFAKVRLRIKRLLGGAEGVEQVVLPYKKLSGDEFGGALEIELKSLSADEAAKWHRVFNLAASANGAKPTKIFRTEAKAMKEELGKEWVRSNVQDWIARAFSAKVIEQTRTHTYGNHQHTWTEHTVFTKSNATLLKGLVWICDGYQDSKTVNLVADLCEKSMKKIPGVGPAAQATANACLWYLEITPGAEATARLSRLATAIKQKTVQKKVAAIVEKKAEAAGITTIQLEERVVPTYGLTKGEKTVAFGDYALRIVVEGPGKVSQAWLKPDGGLQKTKPKFISEKAAHKAKFDKVKAEVAALKKVLTAQRDRVDRLFAEDLEWPIEEIVTYYVEHDLMCVIARRMIWALETDGKTTGAIWHDDSWRDVTGAIAKISSETKVRLWHPIDWETDEVMAWRARMAELELIQPTKQAYREVYLLTDAERKTQVYSNRMAAHMLKQHQMATLMAARGWRYQLMGAYDDGLDDQWAHKSFVTSDLAAEYLLHTNWDEENWNDAGIYLYVGTDQLRFVRNGTPVDLETVPPRLLSETMREADLFVGVASVGNDPAWADQGPTPEARNYWQSYSFGNLDGFAETRKQVLETLLPRLKIRDVAHIEGKFLIVDGKLNTYKIHLGSSNILMSPGDRYLCIVPGGVSKAGQIALPFEGDNRLSVILSKALMLADDDKITASDITSQLKRGR
ncbi:DUF4132 domain-containing protein [Roseovarius sp. 2305UL8-3]|uniref:DUF4132 domain-containing protein n=1 Tax=Roseovarius conchicola TaxID=3121636 RepID=UPI0035286327